MRRDVQGTWSKERERRSGGNGQPWVLTRASQNRNMAWPASSNGGPPTAIAAFTPPKSQRCANAIADHVKAQGIRQRQASCFCSRCAYAMARRRLALVRSASENKQLIRLARRSLALGSSAFQNNQQSLDSQGQLRSTHNARTRAFSEGIVHLEPRWSLKCVTTCRRPAHCPSCSTFLQDL